MNVAIVPARGGSKRIYKKNIRSFCGRPILEYAIEAALTSSSVDDVFVSTDDPTIESIGIEMGAKSTGLRSADLSDDYTGTTDVIRYEISRLSKMGLEPDFVAELYPTAPFLTADVIDAVFHAFSQSESLFAFTATHFSYPVQRGFLIESGVCTPLFENEFHRRSQDLERAFHDAGQLYWGSTDSWLTTDFRFDKNAMPVVIPQTEAWDIDTEEDWCIAEAIYRIGKT